jgi:crossover junction endodeoxyribonuclease RuvC
VIILGIDPGSHNTGWGIIKAKGSHIHCVAAGVIRGGADNPRYGETTGTSSNDLSSRLLRIANGLDALLQAHRPHAVSVETIFHAKDSQAAIKLGHARGAALLCVARFGAPLFEYTAGQIKQAVTGRGRADKSQVQTMIRLLLKLNDEAMPLDASDALAAAMCHAQMHSTRTATLLRDAQKGQMRRQSSDAEWERLLLKRR